MGGNPPTRFPPVYVEPVWAAGVALRWHFGGGGRSRACAEHTVPQNAVAVRLI